MTQARHSFGVLLLVTIVVVHPVTTGTTLAQPSHSESLSAVHPTTTAHVDVDPSDLPGNGTQADPYVITNASELQAMEDDLNAHYTLGADVNASGTARWTNGKGFDPIGNSPFNSSTGPPFSGTFDGAGHTITGLTINRSNEDYVGLFGYVKDGLVHNVSLHAVSISGSGNVGGLTGRNDGRIRNVSTGGNVTGSDNVGGLVGLNAKTIQNALANSSVNGSTTVGGLVGLNFDGTIREASASGSVTGSTTVGGLVGDNGGTIQNASAGGSVNGSDGVGGLVGSNSGTIQGTFAVGNVTGSTDVGGLVGSNSTVGTITDSYWDVNTTGQTTSDGGTGLTTAEMTGFAARTNMTGLDFNTVWAPQPNDYPVLRVRLSTPPIIVMIVGGSVTPAQVNESTTVTHNVGVAVQHLSKDGNTDVFYVTFPDAVAGGNLSARFANVTNRTDGSDVSITSSVTQVDGPDNDSVVETLRFAVSPTGNGTVDVLVNVSADVTWPSISTDAIYDIQAAVADSATGETQLTTVGRVDVDPTGLPGNGTQADPYVITNVSELQLMQEDLDGSYTLGADINASGTTQWNNGKGFPPVGDSPNNASTGPPFSGTFDGAGHTITGLTINRSNEDYVGLFGYLKDGVVRNVSLHAISITGFESVGGLVGFNGGTVRTASAGGSVTGSGTVTGITGGLVGSNDGTIQNVSTSVSVDGVHKVGGLVGINSGTIRRARANSSVNGSDGVGGLVGSNSGTIQGTFAVGNVTGSTDVGGLVGRNFGSFGGGVSDSYWDVNTTGQSSSDGGTGLTTAEMTGPAARTNMTGLEFGTIWATQPNDYPVLRAFLPTVTIAGGTVVPAQSDESTTVTHSITFRINKLSADGNTDTVFIELGNETDLAVTNVSVTDINTSSRVALSASSSIVDGPDNDTVADTIKFAVSPDGSAPIDVRVNASVDVSWPAVDADTTYDIRTAVDDSSHGEVPLTTVASVQVTDATQPRSSQPGDTWPMWGGDLGNTGYRPNTVGPTEFGIQWAFETVAQVKSSPAVVNGTVYFQAKMSTGVAEGYKLIALDTQRGTVKWINDSSIGLWSSPAVADGMVYIGTDDHVTAHDANTGNREWRASLDSNIRNGVKVVDGLVIAGANDKLHALNATTGATVWTYDLPGDDTHTPAVSNGTVYVASDIGFDRSELLALSLQNGSRQWNFTIPGEGGAPTVANGTVYFGDTDQGVLYALDTATGTVKWNHTAGDGMVGRGTAVADGLVYTEADGSFLALDAQTGGVVWQFNGTGYFDDVWGQSAVVDDVVYVSNDDGQIYALNATTGTSLWNYQIWDNIRTSTVVVNGSVYVGSFSGKLFAFDAAAVPQPRAVFDVAPKPPTVGQTIQFDASRAVDLDGNITAYEWDFDSDGVTDATGKVVNYTFAIADTYSVTLRVTDDSGLTGTTTESITVGVPADVRAFNNTVAPDPNRTSPARIAGQLRIDTRVTGNVSVTLTQNTSTNYTLSIDAKTTATNVTFYYNASVLSRRFADLDNVTLLIDNSPTPFYVVQVQSKQWVAFSIQNFSTRTVRFTNMSVSSVRLGDTNGDGAINTGDVIQVQRSIVGLSTSSGYTPEAADVNKDGTVNTGDVIQIQRFIVGLSSVLD